MNPLPVNRLIVGVLVLLLASQTRASCPAECICRLFSLHQSVDCSSLHFTDLPAGLPADTSHLRLGYNSISVLQNRTFRAIPNVARIWLNDNGLEIIDSGAFKYLSSLSWLNLENNRISSIHMDTFLDLRHLFKLVLSGNRIHLPIASPFLRAPSLQILDMENCGLEEIPAAAFTEMNNLMTLRLRNNSLWNVSINITSLSHLDLHKNALGPSTNRLQLSAPRLLRLDLSSNIFPEISVEFLHAFPLLEHLDVSDNIISNLSSAVFQDLHDLQKVNLTNNLINSLPSNVVERNYKLETFDVSNNPLRLDDHSFLTSCSARIIMLERCRLKEVPGISLSGFSNATELHLSNNKLPLASKDMFRNVLQLTSIYLDGNKIAHVEPDAFEALENLTFLDLSRNPLNELSEDGPLLRSASLRSLLLAACGLEALPAAALRGLPALRSLALSGNALRVLGDAPLRAAPALLALRVADNPWRCDCALRPLWLWCSGSPSGDQDVQVRAGAAESTRCVDAQETKCGLPSNRRFVTLGVLNCRENSEEELDLDDDVEWVGTAGPSNPGADRPPPDRIAVM